MIQFKNREYKCSMEVTIDLIGGRWKSLILLHLAERTMRFSELRKMVPQATQKMLTQQLRDLEADGLVTRKVYAEVPPKVEYSLSESGKSLRPVLEAMCAWGTEYLNHHEDKTGHLPEHGVQFEKALDL